MSDPVRAQWGRVAHEYGRTWTQATSPDLGWLVEALAPKAEERALDLGSGAGHASLAVAPRVASVTALDPTPQMLALAAELAAERGVRNVAFVEGRADALPFPAGSFDLAVSRFSVHHWPDPASAFREVARVLRPGGRFGIADMNAPEDGPLDTWLNALELLRDPTHARSLRASEWLALLAGAGFETRITRRWEIRHATEDWLGRAHPAPWRADAVRALLREAPAEAGTAFAIADDHAAFSVPALVLVAHQEVPA